jgi:hypothetical protein
MNISDYPLLLERKHVQEILGVGRRRAYEIMNIKGFPVVQFGRLKRVPRDKFFEWLENQAS